MSQLDYTPLTPPPPPPAGAAGWLSVWIKAITQPNEQTFVDITENPAAVAKTAYLWAFIAGTISGIIQAFSAAIMTATGAASVFQQIPGLEEYFPQTAGGSGSAVGALVGGLCTAPFAGVLFAVFFAISVAIVQWVAKLFGGAGTYDKVLYAYAAIAVPVTIVSSLFTLLGAIPYVGLCTSLLSFGLSIYAIVLQVMAVKAINRFGWGQAIGAVLLPGLVILFVCACVVGVSLALLGPVIGNTFGDIIKGLQ